MTNTLHQHAVIPMTPFGKARPRVTKTGHAYMPDDYTAAKLQLQTLFGEVTVDPPWELRIIAERPMPKSWGKKQRAETDGQFCLTKPDADNIAGAVMDALFPDDDSAVVLLVCEKRWAEEGALNIYIGHADGHDWPPF